MEKTFQTSPVSERCKLPVDVEWFSHLMKKLCKKHNKQNILANAYSLNYKKSVTAILILFENKY